MMRRVVIVFVFSHAHKHTVMDVKWNRNGNWLLTASRDHLIKLFDVRSMKDEVIAFRGHKKEATSAYKYFCCLRHRSWKILWWESVILKTNSP